MADIIAQYEVKTSEIEKEIEKTEKILKELKSQVEVLSKVTLYLRKL